MKTAIIAIGTEVTSGEVINSNAAWLASHLEEMGFEVSLHVAIPDDRQQILTTLDWAQSQVDLLITTGGLGPTTDDFTAEVISDWLQVPFQWNEEVWVELQQLYQARGLKVLESHKTQCWFPQGAILLKNPVGSAHGFLFQSQKKKIAVLPGPPREIEGIWNDSLKRHLTQMPKSSKKLLKKWLCIGITESELADKVEDVFRESGISLGYRASIPYVQVKAWFSSEEEKNKYALQLLPVIQPWLVGEDDEEPLKPLKGKLSVFADKFVLVDTVTKGALVSRFWELGFMDCFSSLQMSNGFDESKISEGNILSIVFEPKISEVQVKIKTTNIQKSEVLKLPFSMGLASSRTQKYLAELALYFWMRNL
ncbi:MAG: competence/damage-inducible protein A [Bdellovibrionales bacterium]|nr:competence/damage-inducible protein A [Bdellovibrionales bacterium]